MRLAMLVEDNWWQLDGLALSLNMPRIEELPLDRFCSFVMWWATRNASEEKDVDKFLKQLWMPPAGEVGQGPWSAEAENASFASLKAGLGQ